MFLRVFGFVYELLQFKYCCGGSFDGDGIGSSLSAGGGGES